MQNLHAFPSPQVFNVQAHYSWRSDGLMDFKLEWTNAYIIS